MNMPYWMYDWNYLMFMLPFLILAAYAQWKVKSTYTKYSRVANHRNLTGAEVARVILDNNDLHHVKIREVRGQLTDHYDPRTQTVALSSGIYGATTISAASVAAHEVGHAIQHDKKYVPLQLRSALVPVVGFTSNFVWILFFAGIIFKNPALFNIGIAFFAGTVLFQLVTLPVEFDASRRAIKQLDMYGLVSQDEIRGSKKVLSAAALTYVAATLTSIAQLIHLMGSRRD